MLADVISYSVKRVKVINTGTINKAVTLKGIAVTEGARAAILQAGGQNH